MVLSELTVELLLAGLAGGMMGAALGALPALTLAGIVITVGELVQFGDDGLFAGDGTVVETFGVSGSTLEAVGVTAVVGLGPALGPHVAFAGGVAAAAFVGRKETYDTTFRYHQAKNITKPLGSNPVVLLVGGAFGVAGVLIARLVSGVGAPVDPIAVAVVGSALLARIAFGYPLVGRVRNLERSVLDMTPAEENRRWGEEGYETAQGTAGRQVVEPWLPSHYQWENVAVLGIAFGLLSGYLALVSESAFLAFGIALIALGFLCLGLYEIPVFYHIALPASVIALAIEQDPVIALIGAAVIGVVAALVGELAQRLLYAHGDTHVDPPFVSLVVTSLLIAALAAAGVIDASVVPYPTF